MDLSSAPIPELTADDHLRGPQDAPLVLFYGDFACPYCALAHERLREVRVRVAFRHFALRAKHPRAPVLAAAAEAAALQGRFWDFHDALFADQGRIEDPHLWARAEQLGLDVGRFDADRRSDGVLARVKDDLRGAMRGGIATSPTLVAEGALYPGPPDVALVARLAANSAS